jgi:Phage Terminase
LIASELGQPLMPWQRMIADVGLEMLEDGRPAYREVIISVPRQNGKTSLILAWEIDRALSWGTRQRIIYSAQTGRDAREKLLEDQVPIIEHSPFKVAISNVVRTNGGESVVFKGGSRISIVASGESAGHGKTIGLGVIDEAFDDVDNRREQALSPAMRTVRDSQLIVASTMGTDASIYLNAKIDTGRMVATEDRDDSRVCYFEWSAPDDADIADPAVWAACTPALGYTIDVDTIRAEYESNLSTPGEFRRFGLNQRTASDERVIPLAFWEAVCSPDTFAAGKVTFAVDCNPERTWASIAVADKDGNVELVNHERGTGWLIPRVRELATKWSASVAVDHSGPAGSFVPDLPSVIPVSGGDLTKACGLFYDAVADKTVKVQKNGELDSACAAAKKRPSGDAWVWARKSSHSDISPIVAATVAYWAAQQAPGPSSYISLNHL